MAQTNTLENLLQNITIVDCEAIATDERKEKLKKNTDVLLWLNKIGYSTRNNYVTALVWFLECTHIDNPSKLLDLKMDEDPRRRYFPAERLLETWIALTKENRASQSQIKKVVDTVRSFFKHNRVPLIQVTYSYKPKTKAPLTAEELKRFREGFNFYSKILFDFLLSVPLRDGQFQRCPNPDCRQEFFPRWRHITTYPKIEPYSPFAIKPQKGHESDKYSSALMQVCFLTSTAAQELNLLRDIKEKALGRKLSPDEYIFTHQRNESRATAHVSPICKKTIISAFRENGLKVGVHLNPHKIRAWDNSILATRGVDKQLRDVYLGHSCSYEEGYIMQLIPQWQQTFKEAKALENLDIAGDPLSSYNLEETLQQVSKQQQEIADLRKQLQERTFSPKDEKTLKDLLKGINAGEIKVIRTAQKKNG